VLALALAVAALAGLEPAAEVVEADAPVASVEPVASVDRRPNIILITADDMRDSDLRRMPATRRLIQAHGVTVTDFLSNPPLCCPARAEILTGQYAQNNGVRGNRGPNGGYDALRDRLNHVGAWLRTSGYRTALVGKFFNGWQDQALPDPGWTVFNPILRGTYQPYGMTMYNNGRPRSYDGVHTSDLVGRLAVRYIQRFSATGAPFFIWTSQVAPHAMHVDGVWRPPVPAARHRSIAANALPPSLSDPAFNEADVSDKPRYVQERTKVSRSRIIALHRARIRSLRSVDEQVRRTVKALRAAGELRNTYIFFTSDNGFLLGEHRLADKNLPYEPALQVPLVVRGPGLPAGAVRRQLYGMVDLAPTFTALAGATATRVVDGRSMLETLRNGDGGYRRYLVQAGIGPSSRWWWRGVRSHRYAYVRYASGFQELYDLNRDPRQLTNVASLPRHQDVLVDLDATLQLLQDCSGPACWTG